MTPDAFDETRRIIAAKAGMEPEAVTRDSVLKDLEIQSLDLAEIIFDLEDTFDIEIELNAASAWESLKTVGDVVDAVASLVDHKASAAT